MSLHDGKLDIGLHDTHRVDALSCPRLSGFGPSLSRLTFSIGVLWPWIVLLISWDRIDLESQNFAHLSNEH